MGHVHIHVHDAGNEKVEKTMHEFKHGELHSGSKKGPLVKKRKQAIAIALKQAGKSNQDAGTSEGARKAAATRKSHGGGVRQELGAYQRNRGLGLSHKKSKKPVKTGGQKFGAYRLNRGLS